MDWFTIALLVLLFVGLIVLAVAAIRIWRRREEVPLAELGARLAAEAGPPPPAPPGPTTFRVGWYLFGVMAVFGGLLVYPSPPLGIAILGLALIYLGTNLHEVRDPNKAFLYRMGKMMGELSAGWYLTIPHFWAIETISFETIEIDIPNQRMYTKSKRPITLHLRVFYRAVDLAKAIFTRKVIHNRVRTVVLSQLKGEVGKREFPQLLTERGELERDITAVVNNEELAPDGYQVTGVEIEDLDENVESQAETIREIGRARGDAARALAEPLRDNYPAAVVSAFGTLAEAAERVVGTIWRRREAETPSPPERGEGAGVAQQLTEVVRRQITSQRER